MKVLLVEDHPIFRFGVRALLSQRWPDAAIGEAATLAEALAAVRREAWPLAVVDLNLADAEGVEVVSQLRRAAPDTRLLVLSLNAEAAYARRVLQLGAAGYLAKDRATEELVGAVERVAAGKRYISQALADQLLDLATGESRGCGHEDLSNQEYRVMLLLAAGRRVGEIAEEMTLSPKTVSSYRTRILDKLALGSNAELARYCQSRGLTAKDL
ncbi:MAG: response regulator transcription factor [Rhodocyclales bacterium]|nr:response regulator transcription factor [Rhodocyclales bacterium]